jgi:hypothetical protein
LFRAGRRLPLFLSIGSVARQEVTTLRGDKPGVCCQGLPGRVGQPICFADQFSLKRFGHVPMTDEKDKSERKAAGSRDSRQERLKQALRENLKRRKSQVRERVRQRATPSTCHETALDDTSGDGGE